MLQPNIKCIRKLKHKKFGSKTSIKLSPSQPQVQVICITEMVLAKLKCFTQGVHSIRYIISLQWNKWYIMYEAKSQLHRIEMHFFSPRCIQVNANRGTPVKTISLPHTHSNLINEFNSINNTGWLIQKMIGALEAALYLLYFKRHSVMPSFTHPHAVTHLHTF